MQDMKKDSSEIVIKLNVEELSPTQIRLIKSVHSLIAHVLVADDEAEYFDAGAALLRKSAELIKHSSFATSNKDISYGDQAVEYAVDFLNEILGEQKLNSIDN
jgi:hypothetical protein